MTTSPTASPTPDGSDSAHRAAEDVVDLLQQLRTVGAEYVAALEHQHTLVLEAYVLRVPKTKVAEASWLSLAQVQRTIRDAVEAGSVVDPQAAAGDVVERLRVANTRVNELSERETDLLLEVHDMKLTFQEIGEGLGIKAGTASSKVHTARKRRGFMGLRFPFKEPADWDDAKRAARQEKAEAFYADIRQVEADLATANEELWLATLDAIDARLSKSAVAEVAGVGSGTVSLWAKKGADLRAEQSQGKASTDARVAEEKLLRQLKKTGPKLETLRDQVAELATRAVDELETSVEELATQIGVDGDQVVQLIQSHRALPAGDEAVKALPPATRRRRADQIREKEQAKALALRKLLEANEAVDAAIMQREIAAAELRIRGMDTTEIAEKLGITKHAATTLVRAGRKHLADLTGIAVAPDAGDDESDEPATDGEPGAEGSTEKSDA